MPYSEIPAFMWALIIHFFVVSQAHVIMGIGIIVYTVYRVVSEVVAYNAAMQRKAHIVDSIVEDYGVFPCQLHVTVLDDYIQQ